MAGRHLGDTFERGAPRRAPAGDPARVLTVLGHPDLSRVGEHVTLPARGEVEVARLAPAFARVGGADPRPLDDPFLSRKPLILTAEADGGVTVVSRAPATLEGGALGEAPTRVSAEALARGVRLVLGERVVLGLMRRAPVVEAFDALGMWGDAEVMVALRREVARHAAARPRVVLVRGPTGAGKELVARALAEARGGPLVTVNVAAVPTSTAAAALFGHLRGAFTGAERDGPGYFGQADGGVLFLDELGELAAELQPLLLRALETGEIQPVGASEARRVDVAVVAATDAPLERWMDEGRFRAPLYHRLAGAVIEVPPLSARAFDAALLFARALLAEDLPAAARDATLEAAPAITPALISALLDHPWPGNVRELRAVARRAADRLRAGEALTPAALGLAGARAAVTPATADAATATPTAASGTTSGEVTDADIVHALEAHDYALAAAAHALGISRTHLDQRIERGALARKAKDLGEAEIGSALAAAAGDVARAAAALRVSARGLRLRMTQLGL